MDVLEIYYKICVLNTILVSVVLLMAISMEKDILIVKNVTGYLPTMIGKKEYKTMIIVNVKDAMNVVK